VREPDGPPRLAEQSAGPGCGQRPRPSDARRRIPPAAPSSPGSRSPATGPRTERAPSARTRWKSWVRRRPSARAVPRLVLATLPMSSRRNGAPASGRDPLAALGAASGEDPPTASGFASGCGTHESSCAGGCSAGTFVSPWPRLPRETGTSVGAPEGPEDDSEYTDRRAEEPRTGPHAKKVDKTLIDAWRESRGRSYNPPRFDGPHLPSPSPREDHRFSHTCESSCGQMSFPLADKTPRPLPITSFPPRRARP
jgi:hypothetical protein